MWNSLDWDAPWYRPWRETGQRVAQEVAAGLALHSALNEVAAAPVRFTPHVVLSAGQAYESYIYQTGQCPTRDNLHDFFNGLAWHHFPRSKRRLNELQAVQIAAQGGSATRGPIRDAITVFDENGALLDAPALLWDALLARNWKRAFVDLRPFWAQARVRLFGHALLEKLARPRKAITAHVWRLQCPIGTTDEVDSWLAARLTGDRLAGKPFTPLPLFGIPGWCEKNRQISFYDDPVVFRPGGLDLPGPNLT